MDLGRRVLRFAGLGIVSAVGALAGCSGAASVDPDGSQSSAGTASGGAHTSSGAGTGAGVAGMSPGVAQTGGAGGVPPAGGAGSAGGGVGGESGGQGGSGGMDVGNAGIAGMNSGGMDAGGMNAGGMNAGGTPSLCAGGEDPPATWQEHWFEHDQNVELVFFDDCVAVYFDAEVNRDEAAWLYPLMSQVWDYSLTTYGDMGPGRLFAVFHQGKYYGGHPSYYFSDSHDSRNVVDQGGGSWAPGNYGVPTHEVAHVVESTALHQGSPAFGLWGDSKWAEIYQYDLYLALGMTAEAEQAFTAFTNGSEDFPRAGTYWFRDWFYPLWRDYGHAQVMARFFALVGEQWEGGGMNWGEYVHFTSGAAGADVLPLATEAFGWTPEWEAELQAAKLEFPEIQY